MSSSTSVRIHQVLLFFTAALLNNEMVKSYPNVSAVDVLRVGILRTGTRARAHRHGEYCVYKLCTRCTRGGISVVYLARVDTGS